MSRTLVRSFLFVTGVVMASACSQGAARWSPTGPGTALPAAGGWSASNAAADLPFRLGESNGNGKKKVSGVGTVASLTGSCEDDSLKFVVQGVRVVTDDATLFYIDPTEQIEGGCGNLRPGTKVKVEAAADPNEDGSYTAVSVTIVDQPGGKPPVSVEGEGTVAALKGTCPTLTMVVRGYPVMTTSSTTFEGGDCEALVPGTKIRVEGTLAANSVVATTIAVLGEE